MYPRDGLSPCGPVQCHPPIRVEEDMEQTDTVLRDTVLIDTVQSDEEVMSEAAESINQQSPATHREGGEADLGPQAEIQPMKQYLNLRQ